jgi:spore coat protein U-like protein
MEHGPTRRLQSCLSRAVIDGMSGLRALMLCAFAAIGCLVAGSQPASAQLCQGSFTNVNFGNIDITNGFAADATGTATFQCSGLANRVARVCPNIGSGSSGDAGTGSPRLLLNGTNKLLFSFFQDSARSVVWGSAVWPWAAQFPVPQFDIALGPTGQATQSFPLYARISSGQTTAAAGNYTSTFSAGHILISSGYSTVGNCTIISATGGTHPGFNVTAVVSRTCNIATTAVDFGARGGLTANIDASGQLRVTGTTGTPYSIDLDGGLSAATSPTLRKMVKGASSITYGLYGDAARTQPWFNTSAFFRGSGTGTGTAQTLNVYGRVPAQATPPAGIYTDSVVVVVTY